jgi:hypothetical protein
MDTDRCPKCNATTVVAGLVLGKEGGGVVFAPTGIRFHFRLWGGPPSCSYDGGACLACGLVWTHLLPEDLLAWLDKYGNDETKLKLSAFQKGNPEQDLA